MNKKETRTGNSKYFNRTCECFARAIEQFTAYRIAPEQYKQYCNREAYAGHDAFTQKIVPLVETLVRERHEFWPCVSPDSSTINLKAFGVTPEENTGLLFKKNFCLICGRGEYKDKPLEAARLLIQNVLPENKDELNTYLLKHGFSTPEITKKKLHQWITEMAHENRREKEPAYIER
jgi:hypothetical protein